MSGELIWRPGPASRDALGRALLVKQYSGSGLKLADRIVNRDVYRGPIALCESNALLRGQFGTNNRLGWVVTSSEVNWESKGIGTLTINWELGGPFVPAYLGGIGGLCNRFKETLGKHRSHCKAGDLAGQSGQEAICHGGLCSPGNAGECNPV